MIRQVHNGNWRVARHACQSNRLLVSHRSGQKGAPIGRELTVISFGKAACALNRGNGRVALVKACWFTQSSGHAQGENMDTEADEEVIEHTSGTLPEERENVTDRGSCRVELAQWKGKKKRKKEKKRNPIKKAKTHSEC